MTLITDAGVKEMCERLDKEFTATFENASKPRPSAAEIVKFAAKRVAYNLVTNTAIQGLALGAVGSALEVGAPRIAEAIGPEAARLAIEAGRKGIEGGQRVLELKKKGHSTKIAGMIIAAEAGIEAAIPTLGLDAGSQAAFKNDFLSAVNKFADELQKPQTLQLIEAAAANKPTEDAPESALIEGAAASAIVDARAKPNSKEPGEAAKKILVERMMNIALTPVVQKLPKELKKKINDFCSPHVENIIDMVVAEAKARLGKALTPKEKAEVDEAVRVSEVAMPKIARAAADHVSDAATALIVNQASSRPAPAAQAVALASIVAAGNIAGEAGVDPKIIERVANFAGHAAGLPIGQAPASEPKNSPRAQIEEENPALAAQARAVVEEANIGNQPKDQKNNVQGLPPQQKQRSRSF